MPIGMVLAFVLSAVAGVALITLGIMDGRTAILAGPFLPTAAIRSIVAEPLLLTGT